MPRRFELGELVTMCKQQVDAEGRESISTAEWKRMIGTVWAELYTDVALTGMRYFETKTQITSDGSDHLDEPEDHLATVGVDRVVSATDRYSLVEIMAQERNRFVNLTGDAQAYALVDSEIRLYPTPPAGQTYEILYVPQPPKLTDKDDDYEIDVVTADGEAFVMWGVAVLALAKEDSDTSLARAERDRAKGRIMELAQQRALNAARRPVADDDDYDPGYPGDWTRGGSW